MEQRKWNIRPAERGDLPALARIYTASWKRTYRGLLPDRQLDAMDEAGSAERWAAYLGCGDRAVWVAEDAGGVFAMAACKPDESQENALLLDSLHVSPDHQGWGAGRALIARAAELAQERGYSRLTVHVVKGNRRAEDLYRRLGAVTLYDFMDPEDGAPSWALIWENPAVLGRK